jgi:hypothetical protein
MSGILERLWERLRGREGEARRAAGAEHGVLIRELMDPGFLRAQLDHLQASEGPLSDAEYAAATAELESAAVRTGVAGESGHAFMPRHPALSVLQSLLETCILSRPRELLEELEERHHVLATHRLRADPDDVYERFGPCDAGWIKSKIAEGLQLINGRPPFNDRPADPVELAADARLIVVGDWGTGLPGAVTLGRVMRGQAEAARDAGREVHVIHLGDVYYSGWREEYEKRFLPFWPVREGETGIGSWSLNGNHDMYSGGHGFFGFLLRDPRFATQQGSSWFSLESPDWQFLGLDTSYLDQDLAGGQAEWVRSRLEASSAKTMLLSHHQLWSAYDEAGKKLEARLAPAFGVRPIDAWFWGHEHRCVVFEQGYHDHVRFGRCLGHGGVPALVPPARDPLPEGVVFQVRDATVLGSDRWGHFGFAVLDLDGPAIAVRYMNQDGRVVYSETLE